MLLWIVLRTVSLSRTTPTGMKRAHRYMRPMKFSMLLSFLAHEKGCPSWFDYPTKGFVYSAKVLTLLFASCSDSRNLLQPMCEQSNGVLVRGKV